MSLTLINHPLCHHIVNTLRDKKTTPCEFRENAYRITTLLAIEASKGFATATKTVETPVASMQAQFLRDRLTIVSILRAGIGMVNPITDLFPNVAVGYIGMERDEETAEANTYYQKLPPSLEGEVFVVDPMLATGGSSQYAIQAVYEAGAISVSFLAIVAAPEGVERLQKEFPDLKIYCAALDERLNEQKYIVPGLGDFGDRLYGTID